MNAKALIKSILQRIGVDVVRFVPELNQPFPVLPLLVREHIASGKPFFFVQVGANDGILDDPLRDLILENHLPGLLIEPLPDIFETLKQSYKDQPQLLFENVAILSRDGALPLYRVRVDASDIPHHWHGIASFDRANLIAQGVPARYIEALVVQGVPLQSVLAKHGITSVNLLQIDTEGYDFEILRAAFDAGIFPDIINYEHCWLVPRVRLKCKEMLNRQGYHFIEAGKDTVAIRKRAKEGERR